MCITDRYDSFSSALDCLLGIGAHSNCLNSESHDALKFEHVRDDCSDWEVSAEVASGVKGMGITYPTSIPPPRPPPP